LYLTLAGTLIATDSNGESEIPVHEAEEYQHNTELIKYAKLHMGRHFSISAANHLVLTFPKSFPNQHELGLFCKEYGLESKGNNLAKAVGSSGGITAAEKGSGSAQSSPSLAMEAKKAYRQNHSNFCEPRMPP
jgi:hypothetical protein